MTRVLVVIGTRPEAIKLFPVIQALRARPVIDLRVCTTGQHYDMVQEVLDFCAIDVDCSLPAVEPGRSLNAVSSHLIAQLDDVIEEAAPDWTVVQGDTTTTLAATHAAFALKVPVAHVEAGLRSGLLHSPWPEEGYRRAVSGMATLHFAPTKAAATALRAEAVPCARIHVTGNTVIDALHWTRSKLFDEPRLCSRVEALLARFAGKRVILVTAHRRESFGAGLERVADALSILANRPDVGIVVPHHPNPLARKSLERFRNHPNVALIEPLTYPEFVCVLDKADLVLTDSGGVQEEASAIGKPVIILRDVTERTEAVEAGTALLAGTETAMIVESANRTLDDPATYARMSCVHHHYGDGDAAQRIANLLVTTAKKCSRG